METQNREERTWAMLCHLSAFAIFLIPGVANIIAPLVILLIKKDQFPLVDDQGKESVNFQISITIYAIIFGILSFVLIGIPFLIALIVFAFIEIIVAAIQANEGNRFRYPLCIRFIK